MSKEKKQPELGFFSKIISTFQKALDTIGATFSGEIWLEEDRAEARRENRAEARKKNTIATTIQKAFKKRSEKKKAATNSRIANILEEVEQVVKDRHSSGHKSPPLSPGATKLLEETEHKVKQTALAPSTPIGTEAKKENTAATTIQKAFKKRSEKKKAATNSRIANILEEVEQVVKDRHSSGHKSPPLSPRATKLLEENEHKVKQTALASYVPTRAGRVKKMKIDAITAEHTAAAKKKNTKSLGG